MTAQRLVVTTRNSAFQLLQSLATNRQRRHATRSFLLEGVQPISTALRFGWRFTAVIVRRGTALSAWAAETVHASAAPVRYEMAQDLLSELSGKDAPSELMAVVQMKDDHLGRIPVTAELLVAVVDRPANPGNLGTLIRSCDAFGVQGLIVTGHAVDLYDPATITATRGSLFAMPVVRMPSHADVATWVSSVRNVLGTCQVVGTDENGDARVFEHDFHRPTVAIFGNETHGLSRAYRELCDRLVQIPITGSASSLNVSVAASIVFYEICRQRWRAPREAQAND